MRKNWFLSILFATFFIAPIVGLGIATHSLGKRSRAGYDEYITWVQHDHQAIITEKEESQTGPQAGWSQCFVSVSFDTMPSYQAEAFGERIIKRFAIADRQQWQALTVGRQYHIRYRWSSSRLWSYGATANDTIPLLPQRPF